MTLKQNGLLFLMVSHFFIFSQARVLEGHVFSFDDNRPLEYATIFAIGKGIGTYSDINGYFRLFVDAEDSVAISYIGFKTHTFLVGNQSKDTIYLSQQSVYLNELLVTSGKGKREVGQLGHYSNRPTFFTVGPQKIATFIDNPRKRDGQVIELLFKLNGKNNKEAKGLKSRVCVRVYSLDKNSGLPGADLLTEKLIIDIKNNQKLLKVDVAKYSIPFPSNGLFVGLDLLGYIDDNGSEIPYTFREKGRHIYIPFSPSASSGSTFERTFGKPWRKTSFIDINSVQRDYDACFGLKIEF